MKFSTSPKTWLLLMLPMVGVHALVKASEMSLSHNWLPAGLAILLLVASCGLYGAVHVLKQRVKGRETLEIGRRGLMITAPNLAPVALAWRMIRSAELVPGSPSHWVFELKNNSRMLLNESEFSREQWKTICAQLERKFRARKIPVSVRNRPEASKLS